MKNLTETACERPRRDASTRYDVMNITLGTITGLVVVARTIFKRAFSHRRALGADDWVVLAAITIGIPTTILNTQGLTKHGLGRDVWTLPAEELTNFVLYFYVMEVLYLTLMAMVKLALSLFYLGIFPGVAIRRLLWGTAAFNVAAGISAVATAIFQCTPISYYWTQWVEDRPGKCIDINAAGWVHGSVNVAVDIWLLAIPLSQIRRLELHWKKKVGVAIMFLTGTFATIVSVLRFQSLIHFANSFNPTWDQWNVAWWSTIETNIGIICTCLPTLRLILVRIFPRVFSGSDHSSYGGRNGTVTTGRGTIATRSIIVHQQVRVSTSTVEIPMTDDLAKHVSGKSWEITTQGSRARSSHTHS
ncbi:extracellular membrane protein, 8-cysteine region, CFEM [Purpureocillium lilacinum]|nr:extracellular membrane protein, 8-cysteine region, CFEM [Purpureocillium lilacinum]OAQ79369.1 extracellular membrane protein, 8-cysteine region, CFEM [Purpureocillium lilacinum]